MVILGLIFEELTFFAVSLMHVNSFYFLIFDNTRVRHLSMVLIYIARIIYHLKLLNKNLTASYRLLPYYLLDTESPEVPPKQYELLLPLPLDFHHVRPSC